MSALPGRSRALLRKQQPQQFFHCDGGGARSSVVERLSYAQPDAQRIWLPQ
jgi:hypothetical protein